MNNSNVEKFLLAVGSLAEVSKAMLDAFSKVGFSRSESVYLVGEAIKAFFDDKKNANG